MRLAAALNLDVPTMKKPGANGVSDSGPVTGKLVGSVLEASTFLNSIVEKGLHRT